MPTADQLALAEILDRAGFAYLEVSGGGCFDAAVQRGVESPWERIRALKARVKTPLGLALRGRFLVGSRPVDADFARRFVASAAQAGAQLIACAVYPLALTLHRVSGEALSEALAGMGLDPGVDVARLWEASDLVDEHIGDEPVAPLAPRIAVRAAQHDVPAGLVAGVDSTLRAQGAGDRLEEVLEELDKIRAEVGWPPLAAPIGAVLANQAMLNVLSASRYLTIVDELRALVSGFFGTPPEPIDPALARAVQLTHDPDTQEDIVAPLDELREQA